MLVFQGPKWGSGIKLALASSGYRENLQVLEIVPPGTYVTKAELMHALHGVWIECSSKFSNLKVMLFIQLVLVYKPHTTKHLLLRLLTYDYHHFVHNIVDRINR